MIYKILMDFTNCLSEVMEKLSKNYNIMFFNNVLYVSKKNPYVKFDLKKYLNNNVCIIEITMNNLKSEPYAVIEWCKDKFVELETIKFETEQQETLKKMSDFIDDFEKNIQDVLRERGEKNG